MKPNYVQVKEAANTLGVSTEYIRRLIAAGRLEAIRLPSGYHRVDVDSLRQLLAECQANVSSAPRALVKPAPIRAL